MVLLRMGSVAAIVLAAATAQADAAGIRSARVCWVGSLETSVAQALRDELASSDLRLARTCRPGRGAFEAKIVNRDSAVYVVLTPPSGRQLDRQVPWLDDAADALGKTARLGRTQHLAILVAGLVAEHRVSTLAHVRGPRGRSRQGSLPRRRHEKVERMLDGTMPESTAAPDLRTTEALQVAQKAELAFDDAQPEPVAAPGSSAPIAHARGGALARRLVPVPHLSFTDTRPIGAEEAHRMPFELGLSAGVWLHSPTQSSRLGIGGNFAWGPVTATLNYQPTVAPSVAETQMLGGAVGFRYTLYSVHWLVVDAGMALDLERQTIAFTTNPESQLSQGQLDPPPGATGSPLPTTPSDTPPPNNLSLWMIGPASSLYLAVPMGLGLRAGVHVGFRWLFPAKQLSDDLPFNRGWDVGLGFFVRYSI